MPSISKSPKRIQEYYKDKYREEIQNGDSRGSAKRKAELRTREAFPEYFKKGFHGYGTRPRSIQGHFRHRPTHKPSGQRSHIPGHRPDHYRPGSQRGSSYGSPQSPRGESFPFRLGRATGKTIKHELAPRIHEHARKQTTTGPEYAKRQAARDQQGTVPIREQIEQFQKPSRTEQKQIEMQNTIRDMRESRSYEE